MKANTSRAATRTALAWLLATQAPLLVSCGSRQRPEQREQTEQTGPSSEVAPPDSGGAQAPPEHAAAPAPEAIDERMSLDILRTANTIAIRSARLARTRSTNDAVQAYAVQIVEDHTAANAKLGGVAHELGLRAEPSPTSHILTANADHARASFEMKRGDSFDRAYIENEIAFHRQVLGLFDSRLIPTAADSSLRALFETQRAAIESHLDHANHVRAALGS